MIMISSAEAVSIGAAAMEKHNRPPLLSRARQTPQSAAVLMV